MHAAPTISWLGRHFFFYGDHFGNRSPVADPTMKGSIIGLSSDKSIEDVQELLAPARDGLIRMNNEHFPLGKLQHLTTAHKAIVDTLYSIHGS